MSQQSSPVRDRARWATALVGAIGMIIAWYLTDLHIGAIVGETMGGPLCGGEGALDCQSAIYSDYSSVLGVPIALYGISFYLAVVVLAVFDRSHIRASLKPFRPAAIAVTTFGLGVGYSLFLAGVSAIELGTFCPYCAMLYGANLIGFVTACLWAGQGPVAVISAQIKRPRKFFNGWTGLFSFAFGIALIAGTSLVDTSIEQRMASQGGGASGVAETGPVDPADITRPEAPSKGAEDAPVQIVEFSSFGCPYCGQLAEVLEQLVDEHGDLVRVEYRNFPPQTHPDAQRASRAGFCADEQDAFWDMAKRLYANMSQQSRADVVGYASDIGLDESAFEQCLDSDGAGEHVERDIQDGQQLGIEGTPTFFVNGQRLQGVVSYEQLEQVVLQQAGQ